jgi:glycine cleavage system H protein
VNSDPEGEGWFFRMTLRDVSQLDGLMDAVAYKAFVEDL